jgi:hypothetical protein
MADTTLPTGGGPDGKTPIYVRRGQDVGYGVRFPADSKKKKKKKKKSTFELTPIRFI